MSRAIVLLFSGVPSLGRLVMLSLLFGVAAGCAMKLTPAQEAGLETVRDMVNGVQKVYGLPAVRVLIGENMAGVAAAYRPGLLTVSPGVLHSLTRDALIAHVLAYHFVPEDRTFNRPQYQAEWEARQAGRALEANAKAVEILQRVKGWPERTALEHVSFWLEGQHMAERLGSKLPTLGHLPPCAEITDLWARFPQQTPPPSLPRC